MTDRVQDVAARTLMHLRRLEAGQARIMEALLRRDRRLEQIESELSALRRDFRPGLGRPDRLQVLAVMDEAIEVLNRLERPRPQ